MTKKNQIFRQAALKRLSSPDQTDRPIKIVSIKGGLALLLLLASIIGFMYWVTSAKAPIKINAQGIIVESSGLNQIISNKKGQLDSLTISLNSFVQAGDVIATIEQPELKRELETSQARLIDANSKYKRLSKFFKNNAIREQKTNEERYKAINNTKKLLKIRLNVLRKKVANLTKLVKRKIIVDDVLIKAQLDLSDAKEKMAALDNDANLIAIKKQELLNKQELSLLDEQLKINHLERSVKLLIQNLAEKQVLRSPHSGKIIEIMANLGDVITSGKVIATITKANRKNSTIHALVYINPLDGKRVKPNMTVEIIPAAFQPQEYGYMLGKVTSISELPVTLESISRTLKNKQLAQTLTNFGAPFKVKVTLIASSKTPSGYRWSSSKGPKTTINSGMLLSARIIVDRVRLINLAIPQFDRLIGNTGE